MVAAIDGTVTPDVAQNELQELADTLRDLRLKAAADADASYAEGAVSAGALSHGYAMAMDFAERQLRALAR